MNEGQAGVKFGMEGGVLPRPGHGSDLVPSLQQLVSSVNAMLRTSPIAESLEDLSHLETTDENFHRYEPDSLLSRNHYLIPNCLTVC